MSKTAGRVRTETGRKRVRAYLGGELVADTRTPVLVWEWPYFPVYYFPAADVLAKLIPAGETEHSPSRGDAEIYDVRVPGATAERAARRYPDSPLEDAARPGPARLGRDERVARGRRAGLHPPPGPATRGWTSWPARGTSGSRSTG